MGSCIGVKPSIFKRTGRYLGGTIGHVALAIAVSHCGSATTEDNTPTAPTSSDTTTLPPGPVISPTPPEPTPVAPTSPTDASSTPAPASSSGPAAPNQTDTTTSGNPATSDTASTSTTTAPPASTTTAPPTTAPPDGDDPAASETSTELLARLDLGWNLGNSLDAPESETSWGNPVVDAALLEKVAELGFDIVRVPVTWSLFTGNAPTYTIDTARLARVAEVVRYARDAGMYVIINLHHDGADGLDNVEWLTLNDANGAITDANNAAVETRFRAVWTQIAKYFEAYDHGLIFESMNEIHDGYDAPNPAYYPIINNLNQVFVDIVRAGGGNNPTRHLVVPGYNTNIDYTLEGFEKPTDPTPNRLILSVHYYDPWSFAGEGSSPAWGNGAPGADTWGQEDFVRNQFQKLKTKYIDAGLPMIIGEYGAVNQTGAENYRRYYMEYVTQAACQVGMVPVYWDNGGIGSGPDSFALINRTTKEVVHPEIVSAMFRGCSSTSSLDSIAKP